MCKIYNAVAISAIDSSTFGPLIDRINKFLFERTHALNSL